jgi:hypothetical protein
VQQSVRAQNLEFRVALLPRGGWVDETKVALESLNVLVASGLLCLLVNLLGSRRSASDAAKRRQTQKDRSGVKDGAAAEAAQARQAELEQALMALEARQAISGLKTRLEAAASAENRIAAATQVRLQLD